MAVCVYVHMFSRVFFFPLHSFGPDVPLYFLEGLRLELLKEEGRRLNYSKFQK